MSIIETIIRSLLDTANSSLKIGLSSECAKKALFASFGEELDSEGRLLNASEISGLYGIGMEWLVRERFVLNKTQAIGFMKLLGFTTSSSILEKQTLKKGRYEARFKKPLPRYHNTNIYTYGEILEIMARPLLSKNVKRYLAMYKN